MVSINTSDNLRKTRTVKRLISFFPNFLAPIVEDVYIFEEGIARSDGIVCLHNDFADGGVPNGKNVCNRTVSKGIGAFSRVGVDFAGPLFAKDVYSRSKR